MPNPKKTFTQVTFSQPLAIFFQAVKKGHIAKIEQLLKKGIDVNSVDSEGQTALMIAAQHGHIDVVVLLLAKPGINIYLFDKKQKTKNKKQKTKNKKQKTKNKLYLCARKRSYRNRAKHQSERA